VKRNPYETERYLHEYLLFHYGTPRQVCPFPFPPKAAFEFHHHVVECLDRVSSHSATRGLDIGCAVGRQSFELTRKVDQVTGIDLSRKFISAAKQILEKHQMAIRVREEGDRFSKETVELPRNLRKQTVRFEARNAQNLQSFFKDPFDVVLAVNLIDRLPQPLAFLKQLERLVLPGGQLLLASPYTWLEEFTKKQHWLGRKTSASEVIVKTLKPHFELRKQRDLPFLIREHRRKYQLGVSEVMVFRKRKSA
jgi:putative 4-mercaptohistidine N1-methyltranferase